MGVPLRDCLHQAAKESGIKSYRVAIEKMQQNGVPSLSEGFRHSSELFSAPSLWLIEQGEHLESLPQALKTASDVTRTELENYCKRLSVKSDTLFLCSLGFAVFVVLLGIWSPLYQIIGNLG